MFSTQCPCLLQRSLLKRFLTIGNLMRRLEILTETRSSRCVIIGYSIHHVHVSWPICALVDVIQPMRPLQLSTRSHMLSHPFWHTYGRLRKLFPRNCTRAPEQMPDWLPCGLGTRIWRVFYRLLLLFVVGYVLICVQLCQWHFC